jgi:hypothetical protein
MVLAGALFAVVFAALPQAESSNANEAMLNVEKVLIVEIFILSFSKVELSISLSAFAEAGLWQHEIYCP